MIYRSYAVLVTLYALLVLVLPVLLQCEMSSLGREDEEESRVSIPADAVAVQRLPVLSQPLANHPALQRGVKPKITVDL